MFIGLKILFNISVIGILAKCHIDATLLFYLLKTEVQNMNSKAIDGILEILIHFTRGIVTGPVCPDHFLCYMSKK